MPAAFFCTLLKLSYARTYIQMLSTTAHQRVSWCVALIAMAVTIWLLERNILEGMCVCTSGLAAICYGHAVCGVYVY